MTPKELKLFFTTYPEAVVYKVGNRFFLAKDKNIADDYARTKELELEVITAKSKIDTDSKATEGTSSETDKK